MAAELHVTPLLETMITVAEYKVCSNPHEYSHQKVSEEVKSTSSGQTAHRIP